MSPTDAASLDAVVFDYGNVVYTWDPYGALPGRATMRQWEDFVAHGDFARWNEMCDAGVPREQIEAELTATYPQRPDWLELQRLYWSRFSSTLTGPVAGTAQVMEDLAAAGVRLYVLTNFNDELFEANRHLCPQLELATGIVVSGVEHVTKPGREIFEILLRRYGLEARRTLFVDDSPANVAAAEALGLHGHLFRGAGRLRAALTEAGLLAGAPSEHTGP
ncbi:HAD family hydrolase [Actinomyces urogenitalis]|uniref:HAD family hydrolase n=1 Tax=Actinomyces urogenitalis TaxID=103621 RepID=UPI00243082EF|nr:HAD family phosphatase [Actinomyces urogenitalis]MCI7457951.1 HAD family phosphatase [Actinomyces urogenitalis]